VSYPHPELPPPPVLPGNGLRVVALGGLGHADVAAALGVRYGTVASRLSRARTKLRAAAGVALPEE